MPLSLKYLILPSLFVLQTCPYPVPSREPLVEYLAGKSLQRKVCEQWKCRDIYSNKGHIYQLVEGILVGRELAHTTNCLILPSHHRHHHLPI